MPVALTATHRLKMTSQRSAALKRLMPAPAKVNDSNLYETGNTDLEYRVCETKVDACEDVGYFAQCQR